MHQVLSREFAQSSRFLARARKATAEQFVVTTCADRPDYLKASIDLENETWDALSFLDFTAAHHAHYDHLLERFADHRLCMIERETGEMVATGMCVPLRVASDAVLPQEGWDWIVDTCSEQDGAGANVIGALSISVPEEHRHRGFARDMINTMRQLAIEKRCRGVIAPVRPSSKCDHPFVAMSDYVGWTDSRGRLFDPWLRSHVAVGGEVVGVCERSMVVEQSIDFWETWTQRQLHSDGDIAFDGALAPLKIDISRGTGRYVEPNVWVTHRV